MLRPNERGIPPHMLHLYQMPSKPSSKSTDSQDDAVHLPKVLATLANHVCASLRALSPADQREVVMPDSARSAAVTSFETQYLGEPTQRDTRWRPS